MNNEQVSSFSELLREYRQRAGLTQEELAERAGISSRVVSDIERGLIKRSRRDTKLRLANALGLDGETRNAFISVSASAHVNGSTAPEGNGQSTIGATHQDFITVKVNAPHLNYVSSGATESTHNTSGTPTIRIGDASGHDTGTSDTVIRISGRFASKVVAIILLGAALLLLAYQLQTWLSTNQSQKGANQQLPNPSPIQDRGIVGVVSGTAGLQIYPVSTTRDGRIYIEVGQPVTATFKIRNTDPTRTKVVIWDVLEASSRGPDACSLGWRATSYDFPRVLERVMLRPGDEYTYTASRSFDLPGVYFVEPTKMDLYGKWGGIGPFPRVYFAVVSKGANQVPPIPCATPSPV